MKSKTISFLLGGMLLFSGIVWVGSSYIDEIKESLNNIKDKFEQAISDNDWLSDKYDSLKEMYEDDTAEANANINELKKQKEQLEGQIEDLENEQDEHRDDNEEKTGEAQNEINRLEGELETANAEIIELATFVEDMEAELEYMAIDRDSLTVPADGNIEGTDSPYITPEAIAHNKDIALKLADPELIANIEQEHVERRNEFTIVGVDIFTEGNGVQSLAYVVKPKGSAVQGAKTASLSEFLRLYRNEISGIYFINVDKSDSKYVS